MKIIIFRAILKSYLDYKEKYCDYNSSEDLPGNSRIGGNPGSAFVYSLLFSYIKSRSSLNCGLVSAGSTPGQ